MAAVRHKVNIAKVVGKGYKAFFNFKGRYIAVKGGRGSKKSTTAALKTIYMMMKMPLANTLVVRRVFNTHKDSTFAQLKWAARKLGVYSQWNFSKSPLEATYKPTGQKILFRGLDDPMSVTSITVDQGYLCWAWFEEAFQITSEDDFNKIDLSLRGELPPGYFKQLTLTMNPWSEKHWIKKRFFDKADPNVLAMTTTYLCNEFLGEDDIAIFEAMKRDNPRRYSIEGMGEWGIAEGLVYENWIETEFDYLEILKIPGTVAAYGIDFGYTDPTAMVACLVNESAKTLHIFDEIYKSGMLNDEIARELKYRGYHKEKIVGDAADPRSIEELRKLGIQRIRAAKKGPDSIMHGIQKIQQYRIIVHPKCSNMIVELSNYIWHVKDGQKTNRPIDDYCHLNDALRYAMESIGKGPGISILK